MKSQFVEMIPGIEKAFGLIDASLLINLINFIGIAPMKLIKNDTIDDYLNSN